MRESFIIHAEYIEDLPEEFKALFLQYIYNYGIKGIEPEVTGLEASIWIKIKRRIDEEAAVYEKKCRNLKNVGNRRKNTSETSIIDNTSSTIDNNLSSIDKAPSTIDNGLSSVENDLSSGEYVSESEYEFVNDSVIECESVSSAVETAPQPPKFKKPSLIDIQDYCSEHNINTDYEKFFNYYESKGWRVGSSQMKDWKAAIKNWAKNDAIYRQSSTRPASDTAPSVLSQYTPPPEPDINGEELEEKIKQIQGGTDEELIF